MSITVRSNEKPVESPAAAKPAADTVGALSDQTKPAPEAKASEQKEEITASGTETTEAKEGKTETDTHEEGETETEEGQEGQPSKKKGGFQRRIDKLNVRVTAAQQEAEYWKQQALKGAGATEVKPTVEAAKPAAAEGEPDPESFNTHKDYVKALAKWEAKQLFNEERQSQDKIRLQTEQAKVANSWDERAKAFSEKTSDYQDVLDEVDHVPLSPAVREILLTSENGPELAYELAKNPDEFARVCKLAPLAAAREMGKLESRLTPKASGGTTETKKITKAPDPLKPIGTGGKGSAAKSIYDSNLSQSEYERLRKEQKRRQA